MRLRSACETRYLSLPFVEEETGSRYRLCYEIPIAQTEWRAGVDPSKSGVPWVLPEDGYMHLSNYSGINFNCKPCDRLERAACDYTDGLECRRGMAKNGTDFGCACNIYHGFGGNSSCVPGVSLHSWRGGAMAFAHFGGAIFSFTLVIGWLWCAVTSCRTLREFIPSFKQSRGRSGRSKKGVRWSTALGISVLTCPVITVVYGGAQIGEFCTSAFIDRKMRYNNYLQSPMKSFSTILAIAVMLGMTRQWIAVYQASLSLRKLETSARLTKMGAFINVFAIVASTLSFIAYFLGKFQVATVVAIVIYLVVGTTYWYGSKLISKMLLSMVPKGSADKTSARLKTTAAETVRCGATLSLGSIVGFSSVMWAFSYHLILTYSDLYVVLFIYGPIFTLLFDGGLLICMAGCVRYNTSQSPDKKSKARRSKVSAALSNSVESSKVSSVGVLDSTIDSGNSSVRDTDIRTTSGRSSSQPHETITAASVSGASANDNNG